MPPHEAICSVNCCSTHIALIVFTPSDDDASDDVEALMMDSIPLENETCKMVVVPDELTYSNHTSSTARDDNPTDEDTISTAETDAAFVDQETDTSTDPTREAWRRLRESSISLGQVLDEKTGFSSIWRGFIQPTLQESTVKFRRLDEEHQLLKTTAESLTRGTEYITQTLSGSIDEQDHSQMEKSPTVRGHIAETVSQVGDSCEEETAHSPMVEAITTRKDYTMELLSRHIDEEDRVPEQTPETLVQGADCASPTLGENIGEEESTPQQSQQTAESLARETGYNVKKSRGDKQDIAKIQEEQQARRRKEALFAPSRSRDQERRAGMNV